MSCPIDEFSKMPFYCDRRNTFARPVWLPLSTGIHTTLFPVYSPARISENRNTTGRGIATFLVEPIGAWQLRSFLESLSFRVCSLFSSDRQAQVFPGNPFEEERMMGGGRERKQRREREREREQSDFARAGAEETRMARERGRPTIPRCLPFIKLLLNAAFHRTHNWIGKTAKIMPLLARYTPAGRGGCNEGGKESRRGRAKEREWEGEGEREEEDLPQTPVPCTSWNGHRVIRLFMQRLRGSSGILLQPRISLAQRRLFGVKGGLHDQLEIDFSWKETSAKNGVVHPPQNGPVSDENIWMFPTRDRHGRRKGPVSVSKGCGNRGPFFLDYPRPTEPFAKVVPSMS